ncbi:MULTISPECIES: LLM class flavin-dependent oxidoreductase [Haloferax]|uniref:LLM class flavin-dependent oxidoreductase n=2 Tax=Haloferax TaxID=2251 RepID=A0A6G1YY05_9EURY|nr:MULTISPECIES: LLM class flavin-dependent oxidoreductase [Haloferax]KAB1186567.1 LLM class flavin-dependent oxidoreductase [Haloferax sp. CBA1149]MRW79180.1 LLM class flavin-dependent oxidoreductase [Haloferax marinisediminis]
MPTGLLVPGDYDDIAGFAERAESLGYDSLWTPELWGRDAFVALTVAAQRTETIDLGTAIVNVYGRSPATLAQAAATLADAADGRVRLGVGTSTAKVVEDLHGMAFDNPPRRLHETIELTKSFLQGDGRVNYEGRLFSVADFPGLDCDIPVYAAALGAANRRATGRVADGWLPHNIPFDRLAAAYETIVETARAAGREPNDITVSPYVPCAVSDDADEAYAAIRNHLAYYLGSSDGYKNAAALAFPEQAAQVADAWRDGDRDAAREAVTDEMMTQLAIVGPPEKARTQFEELAARDVVDEIIVSIPLGASDSLREQTIAELAPHE